MKSSIFKIAGLSCVLLLGGVQAMGAARVTTEAEDTDTTELSRYDRNVLKYRKHWDVLIPTQGVIQTCGNMGFVSMGIGWDYGKRRQWETHLMLGFIPRFDSSNSKITLTLKENFIPWRKSMGKGWWFEPLECTVYFNTVFGHDF